MSEQLGTGAVAQGVTNEVSKAPVDNATPTKEAQPEQSPSLENNKEETESKTSESIPYNRFKEVNDEKKKYKTEAEKYKAELDNLSDMKQFKELALNNADVRDAYNKLIEDINSGKLTKKEKQEAISDFKETVSQTQENKSFDPRVDVLINKQRAQAFKHMNYEFVQLASKDFKDEKDIQLIGDYTQRLIEAEVKKLNPEADFRDYYEPGMIDKYYKQTKELFEGMSKRQLKDYVNQKVEDIAPSSSGSGAPMQKPDFARMSRDEISRYVAENLNK